MSNSRKATNGGPGIGQSRGGRTPVWVVHLLRWYAGHQRILPWRTTPTPYRVWVSEIMLQQTQVATVTPYFQRFVHRFPNVRTLAAAPLDDVIKCWEGLGYYARARHLHKASQEIVREFDGQLPASAAGLRHLPGIGDYTAAAIASIAFGEPVPVVDGNVMRVVARFRALEDDISRSPIRKQVAVWLQPAIAHADPSDFNQAMMELGALVCTPRQPDCEACPLRDQCRALAAERVAELPLKRRRTGIPHRRMAAALVWHEGRLLALRRLPDGLLGGLWEFPNALLQPGESASATLARTVADVTGMEVEIGPRRGHVRHAYSHFSLGMTVFDGRVVGVPCAPAESRRWLHPAELRDVAFSKVHHKIIAATLDGASAP